MVQLGLLTHVGAFHMEVFVEERDSWEALLRIGSSKGPYPPPDQQPRLKEFRAPEHRRAPTA